MKRWRSSRAESGSGTDAALAQAVRARLGEQQEAMNELSVAGFLSGVERFWEEALLSPAVGRSRRAQAVRRARIAALMRSGVVDEGAAALLVDQELTTAEALVREESGCGRWPQDSAISRAVEQTRAGAAQLPEAARALVKINVTVAPSGGQES